MAYREFRAMPDLVHSRSGNGTRRSAVPPEVARLSNASWAFTTRRVRGPLSGLIRDAVTPGAGDAVLARVDAVGYHSALQLPDGRRKHLFVGDEIVVVYGNRYAPNQFEAVVPKTLGPCQLVAAGGVAGKALSWHGSVTKSATQITPLGLVARGSGERLNLRDFALTPVDRVPGSCPMTIAVVGTSMDSGKTQTAAYLVKGLTLAGLRVGFAKVTGTGSGGDLWFLRDAGAHPVVDFTDAGLVSTYLASPREMERLFKTLMAHLIRARVNAIVLEIADGLLQGETAALLESSVFQEFVGGIVLAACDSMGAAAGHAWLTDRSLPLIAVGGVLTSAPLQRTETAKVTGLPVFSRQDLARAQTAIDVLTLAEAQRAARSLAIPPSRLWSPGNAVAVQLPIDGVPSHAPMPKEAVR